ncbi:hypothetical protein [Frigoribacterium sp. CG_9.8]|uniref:hypothetical protein n=1 Tax=Frigoribacterium sp. CG_9.8 TaxID=2787733 RepID=UPI0018CAD7F0|nr:hypothetical protein [Frigoribacterium sp. CG_9.8]MBG6107841.1 hypothetical protein [Frigoribacterium sp. CG_9.8]
MPPARPLGVTARRDHSAQLLGATARRDYSPRLLGMTTRRDDPVHAGGLGQSSSALIWPPIDFGS